MNLDNIYLKYLIRAHTIIGVFVVFIFYLCTYFGTITVFKPYINTWENLSRYFNTKQADNLNLDIAVNKALEELKNPTNNIRIYLPSFREKALSVKFGFSEKVYVDPNTNKILDTSKDTNLISNFFNQMHVNLNLKKPGQVLMGICSIIIIFLCLSGIYLWLINRKNKNKRKSTSFRWHKDLSLIIFPYILIFSMTGAVLGLMLLTSSPFAYSATNGKETNMSKLVRPVIFKSACRVKKSGNYSEMQNLDLLYKKAKNDYPNLNITRISLNAWKDENACIAFSGYLKNNRALSGDVNRISILYKGKDGTLIKKMSLSDTHSMSKVLSAFYFLHFLPDEKIFVRVLFLIMGILFAASLVFGMFIWLEKRASKYKKEKDYFSFISKFSIALFFGVIPASSFLLFLYWFIPFSIENKSTWVIGGFYTIWSLSLLISIYTKKAIKTIKIYMLLNFIFLSLSLYFHGLNGKYFLWESYKNNLPHIFWIDLVLLCFAILSLLISIKIPNLKIFKRL